MKILKFNPVFDAPIGRLWQMFSDIENYPRYIKYCQVARLNGEFKPGSTWTDHSTVAIVPMDVTHQIVKIEPNRTIEYKIETYFGGELWQKFYLEAQGDKTLINIEFTIDFRWPILGQLLEPIIVNRNQDMIEATIQNVAANLKQ